MLTLTEDTRLNFFNVVVLLKSQKKKLKTMHVKPTKKLNVTKTMHVKPTKKLNVTKTMHVKPTKKLNVTQTMHVKPTKKT